MQCQNNLFLIILATAPTSVLGCLHNIMIEILLSHHIEKGTEVKRSYVACLQKQKKTKQTNKNTHIY